MSAIITKFQSPYTLEELKELLDKEWDTNLEELIADCEYGWTTWSVSSQNAVGDKVFFLCGEESLTKTTQLYHQALETGDQSLIEFAAKEKELYLRYAGKIVAIGEISEKPYQDDNAAFENKHWSNSWYAEISNLQLLEEPVSVNEISDLITIQPHTVTKLDDQKAEKLTQIINDKQPEASANSAYAMYQKNFAYRPIAIFNDYLELIFAKDCLWDVFQTHISVLVDPSLRNNKDFFAYHRDIACIGIWRQMLDNMGGGWPITLFSAMSFELLSYQAAGHDLDAELDDAKKKIYVNIKTPYNEK